MSGLPRCPKCGVDAQAGAAFCTACGERFPPDKTVTSTTPGAPSPEAFGEAAPAAGPPAGAPVGKAKAARVPQGTVVDRKYKVDRVLGEGGMGVVYLAEDIHTRAYVVLKAVRPELTHRRDVRERTLAEGRVLARIDHPNVVHLNAVVQDASGLWLVMQYIEGESLDGTIRRYAAKKAHIPLPEAMDLFRQVLLGVGAAHQEGIIHRDLKPANVLVRQKDGVAKVTDFGIAKPEEQARIGEGNTKGIIGSLWYMSPEQVQGRKDLDKRVDIYALGVLLFELLTGRVPFVAESSYELMRKHVEEPLPKVTDERPDLPAWLDEVLVKACAKDREDRFASTEEFLATLDAHLPPRSTHLGLSGASLTRGAAPSVTPPGVRDASPTAAGASAADASASRGSRALVVTIVVFLTLGAAGAAAWLLWRPDPPRPRDRPELPTAEAAPSGVAAGATTEAPPDPLDLVAGRWRSEGGTDFEAVRVGAAVEFRVMDEAQLAPTDYRKDEARFVLRADPAGGYRVEDKIRPLPPRGMGFDPRSRNTCQEVWTEVDGKPLRARFDGARLTVSFAKIAPSARNFEIERDTVVACSGLKAVRASVIQSVLSRP